MGGGERMNDLKNDIEWLEDYVKKDREVRGKTEFESDFDQFCERHCKAIENLLKENENLKQASIINDRLYKEVCNKNKELEEENKKLKKHFCVETFEPSIKVTNRKGEVRCVSIVKEIYGIEKP